MGLQHTVATLEKIYLEPEYPDNKRAPKPLKKSFKDLGISRADLWAFSGLVALDWVQRFTKNICNNKIDPPKPVGATCKWWNLEVNIKKK